MGYYQLDPETNTVNGAFALPQPGNPNSVELPDDDPRVIAWNAPTKALVDVERERRLALGFNYTFTDSRGTHRIGTTEKDLKGWDEVSKVSNAAINTGSPGFTINIVTNTGPCTVTAMEWQQILLAAGQFRQPIWQAFFGLASSNPVPADYTADYHWPPVT